MANPRNACVLGWPAAHSLSPALHGFWIKEHGLDASYAARDIPPEKLEATLRALPGEGFVGCNLTVPHKEAALVMMDNLSEEARAIGAVNTVVVRDGELHGHNTDAHGFIESLRPHAPDLKHAMIMGAGGAARAVVHALTQAGAQKISIANRTPEKAQSIAALSGKAAAIGWARREALEEVTLLVNATTLGMSGQPALDLSLAKLPPSALVVDIVYRPLCTPLLEEARARGNKTVGGLGMLLHQAAPAFALWYGLTPQVTPALRAHVEAML